MFKNPLSSRKNKRAVKKLRFSSRGFGKMARRQRKAMRQGFGTQGLKAYGGAMGNFPKI